ncbi:MAG: hypothetical protein ACFFCW_20000 [Candidatus Hodarchaeota archaeon]
MVRWLEKSKQSKIILVNNNSTFPPLLEYLEKTKHDVHNFTDNLSKWAPWSHNLFEQYPSDYFVVCDPDILPIKECPLDLIEFCIKAFKDERYSKYSQIGPGLEITDLPDHYAGKQEVLNWESRFWAKPLYGNHQTADFFEAPIDSMFSVFGKGGYIDTEKPGARANYPYVIRHETWYLDSDNPSEEDLWYMDRCDVNRAHWIREL